MMMFTTMKIQGQGDFNNDNFLDFIFGGNHYGVEVETVRYDGSKGGLCLGNGQGGFDFIAPTQSGIFLNSDIRDLEVISNGDQRFLIAASNDDSLRMIALKYFN